MRAILMLGTAGLALALMGCARSGGASGEGQATAPSQVSVGGSPANLPAFVKIYPGARVTHSATNARGGVLVLETSAPPEAVMDYYKQAAIEAGLKPGLDSWAISGARSGAHVVMFGGAGKRSLGATVESKGGVTEVGLVYEAAS